MKKFKTFPDSCVGCRYETPTGMCGKLFNLDKFWKNGHTTGFDIRYTRRRHDCPLGDALDEDGYYKQVKDDYMSHMDVYCP